MFNRNNNFHRTIVSNSNSLFPQLTFKLIIYSTCIIAINFIKFRKKIQIKPMEMVHKFQLENKWFSLEAIIM
jgi:hypothetical protein